MNHPLVMYDLAKQRIADDLRQAERDRLIRQAGRTQGDGAIDAVPVLERLPRLLGATTPAAHRAAAGA
jgi:hypothetical protein